MIIRHNNVAAFCLLWVAIFLSGCSSLPDPTPINVSINADANVNPADKGEASPIVIRIYELKSIKTFNNATLFDFDNDAKLLGADLIASREYEVLPGTEQKYEAKVSSEAAYIGVIGSFRNIQSARWRDSIELEKGSKNRLMIYVTSLAVRIQKYSRFSIGF